MPVLAVTALVGGAVTVVAGGGGADEGDASEGEGQVRERAQSPGWETIDERSGLEPLSLSPNPVWGTETGGPLEVVNAATFRDDVAVLLGGTEDSPSSRLAVVDAATGAPRWSIEAIDELVGGDGAVWWPVLESLEPNVVDQGDGWAVLVPYYYSPCPSWCHYTQVDQTEEYGVAALSGDDGHVLWKTVLVPAVPMTDPPSETPTIRTVVTDEDLAVVVVEPPDVEYAPDTDAYVDALRVVAIDPSSGSVRWEAAGVWPEVVAGDTVLARTGANPMRTRLGGEDQREGPVLVALDAATGRRRWDLSERFRYSNLLFTAGDVALVEVPADDADDAVGDVPLQGVETVAIDVETGREVASLGTEAAICRTDHVALIACSYHGPDDDRVATFDVEDRERGVSAEGFDGLSIDAVWDDRVFVTAFDPPQPELPEFPEVPEPGEDRDEFEAALDEYDAAWDRYESWEPVERRWTVDRSGRTVDDSVPGEPLAASDEYVIFTCGSIGNACDGQAEPSESLYDRYAVYRLQ